MINLPPAKYDKLYRHIRVQVQKIVLCLINPAKAYIDRHTLYSSPWILVPLITDTLILFYSKYAPTGINRGI